MAPHDKVGTTRIIPIQDGKTGKSIQVGKEYFVIQIRNAQAVFIGSIWEQAKQLVVASKVALGPLEARAIHRVRSIQKNRAEQLGLTSNIVDLVPATMDRVSVSVEFLLDRENRLATLAGLINDNSLVTMLSFSPAHVAAAKVIGTVAQKIIDTLFDTKDRVPILQFAGDFNLPTAGLRDTYYAILGSTDSDNPLPSAQTFSVQNGELYYGGLPVTQWSYVLLEVTSTEVRTRDLGRGSAWYQKLTDAQARADKMAHSVYAKDKQRRRAWEDVEKLIEEADLLLSMDPLYLPSEARAIIREAYHDARTQIFGAAKAPPTLSAKTQSLLGVADEQALAQESEKYKASVTSTRKKLAHLGVMAGFEGALDLTSSLRPLIPHLTIELPKTGVPRDALLREPRRIKLPTKQDISPKSGSKATLPQFKLPGGGKFSGGGGFGGGGVGGGGFRSGGGFGRF